MEVFRTAVKRRGATDALKVERFGQWQTWTWSDFYDETMMAARAFVQLGVPRFGSVNIIGVNSPEWFMSNLAAIAVGAKAAGIYSTNGPEACYYIAAHSEASVIVAENLEQLAKLLPLRSRLPALKALVCWDHRVSQDQLNRYRQRGLASVLHWRTLIDMGRKDPVLQRTVDARIAQQKPGHCCTLIYTSGTTGQPKAVMISHDNITWTARNVLRLLPRYGTAGTSDRTVSYLPLSHVAAQMLDLHIPMSGMAFEDAKQVQIYFARPDALRGSLLNTLKTVRPTVFFGVPRVWEKIEEKMKEFGKSKKGVFKVIADWAKRVALEGSKAEEVGGSGVLPRFHRLAKDLILKQVHKALGLDQCLFCLTGAAPISQSTLAYFASLGLPVCELFGMSECSGPQTVSPVDYRRIGSCGPTIPGTEIMIQHVKGRDPPGEGEVCFRGRHIMMGYLHQKEESAAAIDEFGYLHSGDVGRVDEHGMLYITGRIKELLVTSGGENIAPAPIENTLKKELPEISNCVLIGDKRKFNSMLICLRTEIDPATNEPTSRLHPDLLNIGSSQVLSEASRDPRWLAYIRAGIDRANRQAISRAQLIQKFVILPNDFSVTTGELTPTLKIKRDFVAKKYHDLIEGMYSSSQ